MFAGGYLRLVMLNHAMLMRLRPRPTLWPVEGTTRSADDTERRRRLSSTGDRHCQLCQLSRRRSSKATVHEHAQLELHTLRYS